MPHLNLNTPIDNTPQHQLEFLENIRIDAVSQKCVVEWYEVPYDKSKEEILALDADVLLCETIGAADTHLFLDSPKFLTNSYIKKLNPKVEESAVNPGYLRYTIEAAPFFGLPNINPQEELNEVAEFLLDIKDVFSDFYERFQMTDTRLQLYFTNSISPSSKAFSFLTRRTTDEETTFLKVEETKLSNKIAASNILTAWAQHMYGILQKIGPHSYNNFTEESFFEFDEDPYQKIKLACKAKEKKEETFPIYKPKRLGKNRTLKF